MHESAILNHAARVLSGVTGDLPADAVLRRHLADSGRLGGRERRDISRAVFAALRWREWLNPRDSLQRQTAAALELQARFNADPRAIKAEALAARAVPPWLRDEMEVPADFVRQLQREPVLWLRARPGSSTRLARELGDCRTSDRAPDALRYAGTQDLFLTPAFHRGAFEIQDLSSQLVGLACAPRAGETWWDVCAGEGGKLLHLSDLMQNKGLLWATDRNARRLATLRRRAARAGVFNFRVAAWDDGPRLPTKTKFDGILLDAPCSGIGTWQRNPHARWTTSPADIAELAVTQRALLEHIVPALRPGGRLIYAVCTLTRRETTELANAFGAAHPELEPTPLFGLPEGPASVTLWPQELEANGMFLAAWRRR